MESEPMSTPKKKIPSTEKKNPPPRRMEPTSRTASPRHYTNQLLRAPANTMTVEHTSTAELHLTI